VVQPDFRPDQSLLITQFVITGTGPNGETVKRELEPGRGVDPMRLVPGQWSFTAEGKNVSGIAIGRGNATLTVRGAVSQNLSISLEDLTDDGTLRFNFKEIKDEEISEEKVSPDEIEELKLAVQYRQVSSSGEAWNDLVVGPTEDYHVRTKLAPGYYDLRVNGIDGQLLVRFSAHIVSNINTSGRVGVPSEERLAIVTLVIDDKSGNDDGAGDPDGSSAGIVIDNTTGETPFTIRDIKFAGRRAEVFVENEQNLPLSYEWTQDDVVQEGATRAHFDFTGEKGNMTTISVTVRSGKRFVTRSARFAISYDLYDIGPEGGLIAYVDEFFEHDWTYMEVAPDSLVRDLWDRSSFEVENPIVLSPWGELETRTGENGGNIGDEIENHQIALAQLEELANSLRTPILTDDDIDPTYKNTVSIFTVLEEEYGDAGWILPSQGSANRFLFSIGNPNSPEGFTPNAGIKDPSNDPVRVLTSNTSKALGSSLSNVLSVNSTILDGRARVDYPVFLPLRTENSEPSRQIIVRPVRFF
jgi:hypothetical protein